MMLTLLRRRNFGLLWWGGLISMMGDWMLMIGLPIYVFQLSNSTLATGLVLITTVVPRIFLGSLAGVMVDRWNRQRTMVVANLCLALSLLPLLLVHTQEQLWIVYSVSFVQSVIRQFFGPAEGALLPMLVGEEDLVHANALNAMNNNIARLLGPPLGGFAAAWIGLGAVALVDALSFAVAAILIALIQQAPTPHRQLDHQPVHSPIAWRALWREWRTGLQLIVEVPLLKHLFLWTAITAVGEGVMGVLMVPFVERVLGGNAIDLGLMMSAQAVGGIAGGFLVTTMKQRFSLPTLLGFGSIGIGLCDFMLFNYPMFTLAIWPALLFFILAGFPTIWAISALQTLMQQATADHYRGRVLGAYATMLAIFGLVGMTAAGYLGDLLGSVALLNVQAAGYMVAGAIFLWLTHRTARQRALVDTPVDAEPMPSQATYAIVPTGE